MTIDHVETRPPETPDEITVERSVVEPAHDDRFDGPSWLPGFLQRGLHRPWVRLAESKRNSARVWRVLVVLNLVLFFLLRQLNAALTLLHGPGVDGNGIRALGGSASKAEKVVEQWKEAADLLTHNDMLRPIVGGVTLATAHAAVGILFSFAWPTALALAAAWLCQRLKGEERSSPRAKPVRTMLGLALLSVPFAIGVGVLQNVARVVVVRGWGREAAAQFLQGVTLFYAGLVLVGVVPLLVGLAVFQSSPGPMVRGFFRGLGLLRIHVITVGTFALLLVVVNTKDQAHDVLRMWAEEPRWVVWGLVGVIIFAAATGASAARVLAMSRNDRRPPFRPRSLVVLGVLLAALGTLLFAGFDVGGLGLIVAGVGMFAIGLFSWFIQGSGSQQAEESTGARPTANSPAERPGETAVWRTLAGLLAAAPLVILGLAALLALTPEALGTGTWPALLALLAVVLPLLAIVTYCVCVKLVQIPERPESKAKIMTGRVVKLAVAPALLAAVTLSIWVASDPWAASAEIGTIGLVGFFLAGVMVVVMVVATITHRYSPPAALAVLGFRRIPVLLLVVIWGAVGVAVDGRSPLHDVRLMQHSRPAPESGPPRLVDLNDYTAGWIGRAADAAGRQRPTIPLVFVSAAGGGIKAASWTALVVHCAFDPVIGEECGEERGAETKQADGWPFLFAVSGASGGSVGLASALAEHLGRADDHRTDDRTDWPIDRLGTDLASASIGWQLFEEAPLALLRLRPGRRDRAEILEDAWSHRWNGVTCSATGKGQPTEQGLFALYGAARGSACGKPLPLFFANGTSLVDGCRFNTSVVDGAPPFDQQPGALECARPGEAAESTPAAFAATRDLADFLCSDEDVRLSTAAFLSARFPYVSPTGRLAGPAKRGRDGKPGCRGVADPAGMVFVGDGGYRDNTGSSTLLEVWERVRKDVERTKNGGPCVVPLFVQINSGYENRSAPRTSGRLFEAIGPITGVASVFGTRDVAGPQQAQSRFQDRFFSFGLRAHPGVQAPLGWSLSKSAIKDITNQLLFEPTDEARNERRSDGQRDRFNKFELERLRAALHGDLTCPGD